MKSLQEIQEWLQEQPPKIEWTEDARPAAYVPIWVLEDMLDELTQHGWSRFDHKYSFQTDHSGNEWLATSLLLKLNYCGLERILVCGSFICLQHYPDSSNILQTGIAEATKAGAKVLGNRFGKNLNERTILKSKKEKVAKIKAKPDKKIMQAYVNAIASGDNEKAEHLLSIYDIKTEKDYAT